MKKILFLSFGIIFLLTGCQFGATKTLNCSYKTTVNSIDSKIDYAIDYEKNEVKKVRITYDYKQNMINDTDGDGKTDIDGVGTGTDGTTNDTQIDKDGIVDGIVGSAIDTIVGGVTDVILDVSGLKDRHATVQNTYNNINGFSVQNVTDLDNNYKVTYVVDYDAINDDDLTTLNLSRNIDTMKNNYESQGFTCK